MRKTRSTSKSKRHAAGNDASKDKKKVGPAHAKDTSGRLTVQDIISVLLYCLVAVIIVSLLRIFVIGLYVVPSGSMETSLNIGDHIVTNRLAKPVLKLRRGDVVVFKDPANWLNSKNVFASNDLVKRLIGLPGDTVACEGSGAPVTVNGVPINESSYLKAGVAPSNFAFKTKVTPGNVFVLGDNRANSADSRYHADDGNHGLVPLDRIRGVAMLTFMPISRFGVVHAHHEVFTKVGGAAHS
ncbi:signal peptidase I [Bifidobacterium sp. ESL0784]|uniref:signal peptidase I n=1 Tax=Bifidobacterium sp. ESL0784 TaxID=2983231 RepID=UPI0023F800BC|nr:signal peptidase I [Bifidobacterium sp. ESL0784]MDF7640019.1 signal peptidase I [Bifidobacterium sp. ESL0784]